MNFWSEVQDSENLVYLVWDGIFFPLDIISIHGLSLDHNEQSNESFKIIA